MHGMTGLGAVQPQDALRDGVEGGGHLSKAAGVENSGV